MQLTELPPAHGTLDAEKKIVGLQCYDNAQRTKGDAIISDKGFSYFYSKNFVYLGNIDHQAFSIKYPNYDMYCLTRANHFAEFLNEQFKLELPFDESNV